MLIIQYSKIQKVQEDTENLKAFHNDFLLHFKHLNDLSVSLSNLKTNVEQKDALISNLDEERY